MMNWDAIGAMGELIGALAVVITILYLAAQVRLSNRRGAADLTSTISDNSSAICDLILSNSEVVDLMVKLQSDQESLSQQDIIRSDHLAERIMNNWWTAEISFRNGQIDRDVYETMLDDSKRYVEIYPGLKQACQRVLSHYPGVQTQTIYDGVYSR